MAIFSLLIFCLVYSGYQHVSAQSVTFDTQVTLTAVDPDLIGSEKDNVADPKNCGSYLFKAETDTNALSLNVLIRDFKSADSLYFRIHPTFIRCIQAAMSKLRNDGTQVVVKKGFQTANDIGSSTDEVDLYHRSGCGIELEFKTGVSGNLDDVITAVLQTCPVPMMKLERDIGIKKMASSVHIHMKGADHTGGPTFDGLSGGYDAHEKIGLGLDPQKVPDCSSIAKVTNGNYFPSGVTDPTDVVGVVDVALNKSMTVDYNRLVQYLGTNVRFDDCPTYTGNANSERCNQRTMTTRMFNVVKLLQKLVSTSLSDKLKITEAFDDSGNNPSSLHSEGRAIKVQLETTNNEARLEDVSQFAVCAGVDYVAHKGTYLLLAVKKMKGDVAYKVEFRSQLQLISVEPPSSKASEYQLPSTFSQTEIDTKYPLFDSSGREDMKLGDNATVSMFMSHDPDYRYFRIDPRLVQCYSDIVYSTNKNLDDPDEVEIEVIRAYLTKKQQEDLMDILDNRYETHTLGVAMQIRYKNGTSSAYTPQTLAQKAVEQCSPIFDKDGEEAIGIGVYTDSVFVDIRDLFELWVEKTDLIPSGYTLEQYQDFMELRSKLANTSRIVDPDDLTEACALAHPPKKQSLTYDYEEPEISKRKRRRKRATADTCVPTYSTTHCTLTKDYLKAEVDEIWKETNRKWIYRNSTEVKYALDMCFGMCGTCLEGDIYDLKLKHCNNLLHWLPFEMMNDYEGAVSNFYARDNLDTRRHACNGGEHCLEKAPLFSILIPSIRRIYRPDPKTSVEELIYASEENPTPVMQILDEIYAISAKGIVYFWVKDETDLTSMKKPLQTVMLYNKEVTEVHIYVMQSHSIDAVESLVEGYVKEFATTGCPKYSRETIAEFKVMDPPPTKTKRSAHPRYDIKNQLVQDVMNWESLSIRGP